MCCCNFFNLTKIPMMHIFLWFLPKLDQCYLLKQTRAGASSKSKRSNLQSNWCALVDCDLHSCCSWIVWDPCVAKRWRSQRRTIIFPTNVERFGLHNFHGLKCWRMNMDKHIKWNALYACLWKVRILFRGWNLIYMQEKQRQFMTCHI